ncbi:MAG: 4-carboxymuconolactone decarboxylase [Alphaproteobacteria bacterium]|nr:4-carboxymuconolactone decarboxylase [Alphaproteobacteria bacterium]
MPSDIDPKSGFRLPLLQREDLDEVAKQAYDDASTSGRSVAGLQGPAGIQLYSPSTIPHLRGLYKYLRFEAGFSARTREIALLVVAREMDSQFQWGMHEKVALNEGVETGVIEVIRHRKSTNDLNEIDAVVIELGRQAFGIHKVAPETFARAKAQFGAHRLVDLVLLMGSAANTSALLSVFDMQLRPGMEPRLPIP